MNDLVGVWDVGFVAFVKNESIGTLTFTDDGSYEFRFAPGANPPSPMAMGLVPYLAQPRGRAILSGNDVELVAPGSSTNRFTIRRDGDLLSLSPMFHAIPMLNCYVVTRRL